MFETRKISSMLTKDLNQLLENGVDDSALDDCKEICFKIETCQNLFFDNHSDANECTMDGSNPCQNGGTCSEEQGSRTCKCTPNWTGSMCNQSKFFCIWKKLCFSHLKI